MKIAMAVPIALFLAAPNAFAGMYVTGSLSGSTSNVEYQSYESGYGSLSMGVDLGRYVRLSFTHSQEFSTTDGYKDPRTQEELKSSNATDASANNDPTDDVNLVHFSTRTHVIGNSVDLQLILYEGQIFVPYITGGLIVKRYDAITKQENEPDKLTHQTIPGPEAGLGIGMRLNSAFTLKLSYVVSPGASRNPGDAEKRAVWDRKVTMGLTYQLQ